MPESLYDVKSFTPIDLALLRRAASRGISLDLVTAIENDNPLEAALLHVVGLKGRPTYILRCEQGELAAQMRLENRLARITLLAPSPNEKLALQPWLALVETMIRQAGHRGAYLVVAECPIDSATFTVFRHAGFTVYSRESLYCFDHLKGVNVEFPSERRVYVRPIDEADDARLYTLYSSTVPHLAQQVIPPPQSGWEGLAIVLDGRVMGCFLVFSGKNGLLLQPYLHPELYDLIPQVLSQALALLPAQKIFVRLHAYQEWMRQSLEQDFGFELLNRYALMAKHTVVKRETQTFSPLAALEQVLAPPTIEVAWEITTQKPSSLKNCR